VDVVLVFCIQLFLLKQCISISLKGQKCQYSHSGPPRPAAGKSRHLYAIRISKLFFNMSRSLQTSQLRASYHDKKKALKNGPVSFLH
jgi:hypothetical protein